MGEETKQQEETKKEEKIIEEQKEDKAEEKKEESAEEKPPAAAPPFVLFVDLHCVGCAKKIERSILKIRGVEGVGIDMAKNEVTIKGVVEPQAVCSRIMKKTKRRAKVLSPLPAAEGEPIPEVVASQVSGLITIELDVNMHCEACAQQLNKKILKMKGVRTVETELSTSKVRVTGTMDADRLVDYVYRRTKKQAKIVPQPQPAEPESEKAPEEKKDEKPAAPEDEKKEEAGEAAPPPEEENKDSAAAGEGGGEAEEEEVKSVEEQQMQMQRMMYQHYQYQPIYVMERIPPAPQLFSDENPNACVVM